MFTIVQAKGVVILYKSIYIVVISYTTIGDQTKGGGIDIHKWPFSNIYNNVSYI